MPDIYPAVTRRHRLRALQLLRPRDLVHWMLLWAEHDVVSDFKSHAEFQDQLIEVARELAYCEQRKVELVGINKDDLRHLMDGATLLYSMLTGSAPADPAAPTMLAWRVAEEKTRMRASKESG